MDETNNNQFRQAEATDSTAQTSPAVEAQPAKTARPRPLGPVAIVLGLLLIIGGISLGVSRSRQHQLASLPEYNPVYVSPAASPAASPAISPSPVNSPVVSQPTIAPAKPQSVAKSQPIQIPKKPVKSQVVVQQTTITAQLPAYVPSTLPDYQPVVVLADYQPQFVASDPSPTPTVKQTISVTLAVSGKSYSLEVVPGSTVLAVLEAARSQGLSYETQEFSGLGQMVTSINGQSQGNGKYWLYSINGQFASKGASSQTVNVNDVIVWSLS